MSPRFVLFAALALIFAAQFHLAERLVFETELQGAGRALLLVAIFGLLPLAVFRGRILSRLPRRWHGAFAWLSFLWLGLAWIALCATLFVDIAQWIWPMAPTERALGVAALVAAGGALSLVGGLSAPRLRRHDVHLQRLPPALDGFRIVQLSDVHVGPIIGQRFVRRMVETVRELEPDLVAVTGDLVDGPPHRLQQQVAPLRELKARCGVYFVTGNHDRYAGDDAWVEHWRSIGWAVLRGERHAPLEGIEIAGIDDETVSRFDTGDGRAIARALEGRRVGGCVVLLSHNPAVFPHAVEQGVDLQISGHTHGGQIWPFVWLVRVFHRWVAGLYRDGDAQIYVSRGTGFWGPPLRLFAPAEITELTLRCAR